MLSLILNLLPFRRKIMNAMEAQVQKLVVKALTDVAEHKQAILKLITLGKISDPELVKLQAKLDSSLKIVQHFVDVADGFIPSQFPILKDVLDWSKAILDVLEPATK